MMGNAQSENLSIVNYTIPPGYQLIKNERVLTYYKEDKSTGAYCNFFIYSPMPGYSNTQSDFDYAWANLVQNPFKFVATPVMQPEASLKGWKFLIGTAKYDDNGVATLAMLINFSGGNKMQGICILSNSDNYKTDIESFIASVEVARKIAKPASGQLSASTATNTDSSIAGTWTFNEIQSTGLAQGNPSAMIGLSNETGYQFNPDGTYHFFKKLDVNGTKKISFAYETGKWSVSDNRGQDPYPIPPYP